MSEPQVCVSCGVSVGFNRLHDMTNGKCLSVVVSCAVKSGYAPKRQNVTGYAKLQITVLEILPTVSNLSNLALTKLT